MISTDEEIKVFKEKQLLQTANFNDLLPVKSTRFFFNCYKILENLLIIIIIGVLNGLWLKVSVRTCARVSAWFNQCLCFCVHLSSRALVGLGLIPE